MKNWKKGKKTSDTQYFIHIPSRNKPFAEQQSISVTELDRQRGYSVFYATGKDRKAKQYQFKTKSEASAYARKKMRSVS